MDVESPLTANLFSVTAVGSDLAIAVGEQGNVLVTTDGGKSWDSQVNITGKTLQAIVYRGGTSLWVGGRGGVILKRTRQLSPSKIVSPKLPPVFRLAPPRYPKPRMPILTVTDDGDIPFAILPKKPEN